MRLSKYTSLFKDDTKVTLFNLANEKIMFLENDLAKIFEQKIDDLSALKHIHPSFFEHLSKARFIVPDDTDETKELIAEWKNADNDNSHFGIIINPTLNCNLRCWYCYEEHNAGTVMTDETKEAVFKLIKNKTDHPSLKSLNVSFFGGEPLLYFKKVVMPILKYASDVCIEKGIKLYSNFTTNGVLLSEEVIQQLNALRFAKLPTFQITLDGNDKYHNSIRVGLDKKPTYETIVSHIAHALQHGNETLVRFNYTHENILSFLDVLDDLKKRGLDKYPQTLSIKFEHVWQDLQFLEQTKPKLEKVRDAYAVAGFRVGTDDIHFRHVCYADSPNHFVINYNGDVFKCTARDFIPDIREGVLDNKGELIMDECFSKRMSIRYANPSCLECKILPLCNGGCTQNKMDSKLLIGCYRHMDEQQKDEYLKARLDELLEHINNNGTIAQN